MDNLRAFKTDHKGHSAAVEVVDEHERPFLIVSRPTAQRLQLPIRSIVVLVYNLEGKVFVQQRSDTQGYCPGCWDLSATGAVLPGESRQEAAERNLQNKVGIRTRHLKELARFPALGQLDYRFVTLFSAGRTRQPPQINPKLANNGYYFDPEEIDFLCRSFSDRITPDLNYFWQQRLLFTGLA